MPMYETTVRTPHPARSILKWINIEMEYSNFIRTLGIVGISCVMILLLYGDWQWIVISLIYYKLVVGLLGNQIALHRYFSHNSFKTTRLKKFFLYYVSLTTGINPYNHAQLHRHHHVYADSGKDLHSWKNSIWDIFSPITYRSSVKTAVKMSTVLDNDLMPLYKWFSETMLAIIIIVGLINWKVCIFIFLAGIGWNYIHMILFRVFLDHYKLPGSYKNFNDTGDNSYNNKLIVLLDIGEGLHNNHHKYPNRYNQAITDNEFDPAGWIVSKFFAI